MGREYRHYLLRGVLRWGAFFGGFVLFLVVAGWVRGRHPWFDRSDLVIVLIAVVGFAAIRMLMEVWPRTITVKGNVVLIFQSRTQPVGSFDNVRLTEVDPQTVRVEFEQRGRCLLVVGATPQQAEALSAHTLQM